MDQRMTAHSTARIAARTAAGMATLLALVACTAQDRSGDVAVRADSGAAKSAVADSTAPDSGWTMYPDGARSGMLPTPDVPAFPRAQVRIGMTSAEVRTALALPGAGAAAAPNECAYIEASSLPGKLHVMTVSDTVVRIDVRDSTVRTAEGARVGDSEARVRELYAGRVTTQPHKYTGPTGHYLVVTSPADTTHLIVFETDGERVTNFRVGRKPEVQWVEGCS